MKLPIYPGEIIYPRDLRIFSLNIEDIAVIRWHNLRGLLLIMSREALISKFAPDEKTARSWRKNLKTRFHVINKIYERHFVK